MASNATRILLTMVFILFIVNPSAVPVTAQSTDLTELDSDGDGISDWDEINRYWSDPYSWDTDGDGISDGKEVEIGTSPIDTDSDGDGFSDSYEYSVWNPLASNLEDRLYRCPYVADLPSIDVSLVDGQDNVIRHYYFKQGEDIRNSTLLTEVEHTEVRDGNGNQNKTVDRFLYGGDFWLGLKSQQLLSGTVGFGFPGLTGEATVHHYIPYPYLEVGGGFKSTWGHDNSVFYDYSRTQIDFNGTEDRNLYEYYTEKGYDFGQVTLVAYLELSNNYDRVYRLDNLFFNFESNGIVYKSLDWEFSPIVLGVGEKHELTVSFDIEGEEWIQDILWSRKSIKISPSLLKVSVYDNEDGWISQEVMEENVRSRCVEVEIVEDEEIALRKHVTATVDKIDGLNAIEALDRLFQDYDYRYGRFLSLRGIDSRPGSDVWTFQYYDRYFETGTSRVEEYNPERIRMWGRGYLCMNLDRDSDGDWLPDSIDPYPYETDHDSDYADDYVEIVILGTQPNVADSDGGGTMDGIEYYEGLNPLDPSDDLLDFPEWYLNHITLQESKKAVDHILDSSSIPASDQMTWDAPTGSSSLISNEFGGDVFYATNSTIDVGIDESILSIATGDLDNDNVDEIVVGTYPSGYVILYDNTEGTWESTLLGNLSHYYSNNQVRVWDIAIGDADNNGQPDIIVGTWHKDAIEEGHVLMYYELDNSWRLEEMDYVTGGVYSVAVGDVYGSSKNQVVVGQGGSETVSGGAIVVFEGVVGAWDSDVVCTLSSPKVDVTIGDYGNTELEKIVFCTNALNSTLGFCEYDTIYDNWTTTIIDTYLVYAGDPPPYQKYSAVQLGDPQLEDELHLFVAVDHSSPEMDRIEKYKYPALGPTVININQPIDFSGQNFVVGDIDNDNIDDIAWHSYSPADYPNSSLLVIGYNSTASCYTSILIENTTDQVLPAISVGDIDGDGESEMIYGTSGSAFLRYWDHPEGTLWPSQELTWNVEITTPQGPIYEDECYLIDLTITNLGDMSISDFAITVFPHTLVDVTTPTQYLVEHLSSCAQSNHQFELSPKTAGRFSIGILGESKNPLISFNHSFDLFVYPRTAYQVKIANAILDLSSITGDEVMLDAAISFGNWLHEKGIRFGTSAVWNGDANKSTEVLSGHILATAQTGQFFLDLYQATNDLRFLSDAFLAARYLGNTLDSRSFWSTHGNGLYEAALAGLFIIQCKNQLMTTYFDSTIEGLVDYFDSVKSISGGYHWNGSFKLTETICRFLGASGYYDSTPIHLWLLMQAQDSEWLGSLPIMLNSAYLYNYTDIGLAGVTQALTLLGNDFEEEIAATADVLVDERLVTVQGTNWRESVWTTNLTRLCDSINWHVGSAGIMTALTNAYRVSGTQKYLDTVLDAVTWTGHCFDEIIDAELNTPETAGILSEAVESLLHLYSTLPVVSVGYFVDPMTSLDGEGFTLTGYVQTNGWHARDINMTAVLPGVMLLEDGQEVTIPVGNISDPGVTLESWEVKYIATSDKSLLYGTHELRIQVQSSNAGDHSTSAKVEVTDVGVEKIGEDEAEPRFAFLSTAQDFEDELYSVAEDVLLPIRVEYYDGSPAINASVSVGDYGRGIVNGSGYAYFPVTSYEVGEIRVPVSLEYDKKTGITSGTANTSVSLVFTNLEVYNVEVDRNTAVLGDAITIEGRVRYAHNQEIAAGATVYLNKVTSTKTDATGAFKIEYRGSTIGLENLQVLALIDEEGKFYVPTVWFETEVEWTAFWTPLNVVLVLSGAIAASVVVAVLGVRLRKRRLSSSE